MMSESAEKKDSYLLQVGSAGENNLNLQNEILYQSTLTQLKKAGISAKMTAWDLGCGTGAVTEMIAREVGSEGKVFALDISKEQLKISKSRIMSCGFNHVEYIHGALEQIQPEDYPKAHLVHARLLLMHVREPVIILEKISKLSDSNAVVVLQESAMDSLQNMHPCKSINRFYELMIEYGTQKGLHFNIGSTLETICLNTCLFKSVEVQKKPFQLDTLQGKRLLNARFHEIKDKLIDERLTNRQEMEKIKNDLERYPLAYSKEDSKIFTQQTHIIAYT